MKNGFVRAVHLRSKKERHARIGPAVDRDETTLLRLTSATEPGEDAGVPYRPIHRCVIELIATDGNYSYGARFPIIRSISSAKPNTCLVEAKDSSLREMLARLNRRTKRYSKSLRRLRYSVWLWMVKDFSLSIYSRQCRRLGWHVARRSARG